MKKTIPKTIDVGIFNVIAFAVLAFIVWKKILDYRAVIGFAVYAICLISEAVFAHCLICYIVLGISILVYTAALWYHAKKKKEMAQAAAQTIQTV